mgnify:CR=1 FL=1
MAENNNNMEFVKLSDLDFLEQTAIEAELCENEPTIQNITNVTNVSNEVIEIHDVFDTGVDDQGQEDDTDPGADPDADAYSEADTDSDEDADAGAVTDMEQHQYVFDTVRGPQYSVQGTSDGRVKMFTLNREGIQTGPALTNDTGGTDDTGGPGAVAVAGVAVAESANELSTQARDLANRIKAAIASRYRYQTKRRSDKADSGSEGVNEGVTEEPLTENDHEEDLSGHVEAAIAARYDPESESDSQSGRTFDEMNEELACLLERMRNLSRINSRFREFFFDDDVMTENWPRNMRPRVRIEQYEQCYSKIVEMDIQDWGFPDPDNFQRMIYRDHNVPRIFRSEKRIRATLESEDSASDDTNSEITHEQLNVMERQVDENLQHAFRDPSTPTSSDEDEVEVIEMIERTGSGVAATMATTEASTSAASGAEARPGVGTAEARPTAEVRPTEKSSEEEHDSDGDRANLSDREMANLSAWENRSASQERYLAQKQYQEELERGRRNRRLILRCMRYPGGQPTVVINRLPKQIREMTHLYPGSNPNAGRDREEDDSEEDDSEDESDPPRN